MVECAGDMLAVVYVTIKQQPQFLENVLNNNIVCLYLLIA